MPVKTKTAPLDDLDKIFAGAEKKYGSPVGTLATIGSDAQFITTGNMGFDLALGGGFALGRIVELAGPEGCGKTTLAAMAVAGLQKVIKSGGDKARGINANDVILYVDFENAVDKAYMQKLGVDIEHTSLRFTQPDYLEDGAQLILDVIETGRVRVVVVDSVAAMNPKAVAENEVGKSLPAIVAKILTPWGTTLQNVAAKNNCLVIFINHEKEVMGMGGPAYAAKQTTTPGGKALKYFASTRVSFRVEKKNYTDRTNRQTQEKERIVESSDVRINVIKNKVAPPFQKALARVRINRGFDNFWTAFSVLLAHKHIVSEPGGMFYFHRTPALIEDWMSMSAAKPKTEPRPYIRGEQNIYAMADQHPDWREAFIAYGEEVLQASGAPQEEDVEWDEPDEDDTPEDLTEGLEAPKGNTVS